MKNLRSFLLIFTFAFSSLSYAQEPSQMQKVITTHDEIMAKIPNLVKLIGKLEPKVDSTTTGKNTKRPSMG